MERGQETRADVVSQCENTLPLRGRQLENLVALARLVGYVRFFHPSDGVAAADWNQVAVKAIDPVEAATDAESLAAALTAVMAPLAPTVRVVSGLPAGVDPPLRGEGPFAARWVHHGVYLRSGNIYRSTRVTDEAGRHRVRLSALLDAEPLRGRRLRARAIPELSDRSAATATLGLRCGKEHADTAVASGPASVELSVPSEAEVATVVIGLTGRACLTVTEPVVEVGLPDGSWRQLELRATELVAQPEHDIPFGWDADMTVPYRITAISDSGRRALRMEPVPLPRIDEPLRADLGGAVSAVIPMALTVTEPVPEPTSEHNEPIACDSAPAGSIADRATRLANVVLLWSTLQHFYPYFDVIDADWDAELPRALTTAATAPDRDSYLRVLRGLVAALADGHAGVFHPDLQPTHTLPLALEVIEGALVLTSADPKHLAAAPGTVVLEIAGRPALEALAGEEALISGSRQWKRTVALRKICFGPAGEVKLALSDGRQSRQVTLTRVPIAEIGPWGLVDPLPEPIAELGDGIQYLDLARASAEDIEEALPRLRAAAGLVVDLRGYPKPRSERLLRLLIDQPVRSAQWRRPVTAWPNRHQVVFDRSAWFLSPERPAIKAPVAFITDARAISYAESCMAIVKAFGLGTIVGAPTAGANGNNNPSLMAGGLRVGWTGMRVLNHDGSTHHTVGVAPDIPTTRTRAGIKDGRDELLERAVEHVSQAARP